MLQVIVYADTTQIILVSLANTYRKTLIRIVTRQQTYQKVRQLSSWQIIAVGNVLDFIPD